MVTHTHALLVAAFPDGKSAHILVVGEQLHAHGLVKADLHLGELFRLEPFWRLFDDFAGLLVDDGNEAVDLGRHLVGVVVDHYRLSLAQVTHRQVVHHNAADEGLHKWYGELHVTKDISPPQKVQVEITREVQANIHNLTSISLAYSLPRLHYACHLDWHILRHHQHRLLF